MLNPLLAYLEGQVRSAAVGPLLWLLSLVLFAFVMWRNFQHVQKESVPVGLDEGEREVDQIRVSRFGLRTHSLLTTRRVVQGRFSWFLSKRKARAISLDDVCAIVWRRYTNWVLLLLAVFFISSVNPVALLLLLFGLQSKIYSLTFAIPVAQLPFTRVAILTTSRRQLSDMRAFYERALDVWSRMIVEKRLATAAGIAASGVPATKWTRTDTDLVENDFAWGPALLAWVGLWLALGIAQRIVGPHISFDDYVFGPVYIGLVAAVATRKRRDGAWLALLGPLALLTLKFPGSGLTRLVTDGGSPLFEEYVMIIGTLLLVAATASALARVHCLAAPFAVLLWALVSPATSTGVVGDMSLLAKLLIATGWAMLLPTADDRLRGYFAHRDLTRQP